MDASVGRGATGRHRADRPPGDLTEKRYDFAAFDSSLRRARAFEFIEERRARTYVNEIEVLVDLSPT